MITKNIFWMNIQTLELSGQRIVLDWYWTVSYSRLQIKCYIALGYYFAGSGKQMSQKYLLETKCLFEGLTMSPSSPKDVITAMRENSCS